MTRVFASDFDGTLYFMGQKEDVRPADIAAIEAYQRHGGLFGVCTGRSLKGVRLAIGDRVKFDFYILVSGSLILDSSLKTVYKRCISRELLSELCERYSGYEMVIQANDTVYTFGHPYPLQTKIAALEDIAGSDLYGVSLATESVDAARRLTEEINADYPELLTAHQNIVDVDVAPKGCSKGRALDRLRTHFAESRIGAIGDAYNDIPMLDQADMPFTFPYAPAEVRSRGYHIVSCVGEALELFASD